MPTKKNNTEIKQYHVCTRSGIFINQLDYGDSYPRGLEELKATILEAEENGEDIDNIIIFELTNLKVRKKVEVSIEE